MIVKVRDIFRGIFRNTQQSFSVARRICFQGQARLNGECVNFWEEVEINEGDRFEVGKTGRHWVFKDGQWVRRTQ